MLIASQSMLQTGRCAQPVCLWAHCASRRSPAQVLLIPSRLDHAKACTNDRVGHLHWVAIPEQPTNYARPSCFQRWLWIKLPHHCSVLRRYPISTVFSICFTPFATPHLPLQQQSVCLFSAGPKSACLVAKKLLSCAGDPGLCVRTCERLGALSTTAPRLTYLIRRC